MGVFDKYMAIFRTVLMSVFTWAHDRAKGQQSPVPPIGQFPKFLVQMPFYLVKTTLTNTIDNQNWTCCLNLQSWLHGTIKCLYANGSSTGTTEVGVTVVRRTSRILSRPSNVVAHLTKMCRPVGCCPVRLSSSCLSPSWFVVQMTVHQMRNLARTEIHRSSAWSRKMNAHIRIINELWSVNTTRLEVWYCLAFIPWTYHCKWVPYDKWSALNTLR